MQPLCLTIEDDALNGNNNNNNTTLQPVQHDRQHRSESNEIDVAEIEQLQVALIA